MLPNLRAYHRPTTLEEAIRLVRPPAVVPLGGGTQLIPSGNLAVEAVVDLSRLGLTYVRPGEAGISVGATTTLQQLLESDALRERTGNIIGEVLCLTASRNLRGQATVGGTVAAGGAENPLLVLLLALDARVTVWAPQEQQMPLDAFLGQREAILRQGVIITELLVPHPTAPCGIGFAHVGRTPRDRPIVCAAVSLILDGDRCREVFLALGGVAERPVRASRAEEFLRGQPLTPENIQEAARRVADPLNPPSDFRGSGEYRRAMAEVLAHRALNQAARAR